MTVNNNDTVPCPLCSEQKGKDLMMIVRPSMIILQDNRILLMKYNYNGQDLFGLPGGNPDDGETLAQTLVRELQEELNLIVEVDKLALIGEVILEGKKKSTLHCVFWGRIISGSPEANPEHTTASGYVWLDADELDTISMYPNVGRYIKDLVRGKLPNPYIGLIPQQWF